MWMRIFALGASTALIALQPSVAQLVPDSKPDRALGTVVQPTSPTADLITGGTRPGSGINLFHSFAQFNVGAGRSVYFETPTGVQNILTRVTGTTASNIFGTLGTTGNANLFLMNPNGIIFGETARLDVRGSFIATTANAVKLGEVGQFSASDPQSSVLLNINPSALLINQITRSQDIELNQTSLSAPPNQSLILVGGAVRINGDGIFAPDSRVELGGLAAPGAVQLTNDAGQIALSFLSSVVRSDVSLNNGFVGVPDNGRIAIYARNIDLSNNSFIGAGIYSEQGTNRSGKITLDATDAVTLRQQSTIANLTVENTIGNSGGIDIRTGSLFVLDGSFIETFQNGQGNAGDINITARDRVVLSGSDEFGKGSTIATGGLKGKGNSGDIRIRANTLELTDGGQMTTSSNRAGNSGNILLNIGDRTTIKGTAQVSGISSGIYTELSSNGVGTAGSIQLTTPILEITKGGEIRASTYGQGNGGSIFINARNGVVVDGVSSDAEISASKIVSDVLFGAIGNGGTIQITTSALTVKNGANISAGTAGRGDSGKIVIEARDRVAFDGQSQALFKLGDYGTPAISSASTAVLSGAIGNGGDIQITTGSLDVLNGARILADTGGQGNSGQITIRARDRVLIDGTGGNGVSSSVRTGILNFVVVTSAGTFTYLGLGRGGDIQIEAKDLIVSNGAAISSVTDGPGKAGNILLNARNAVIVQGNSPVDPFNSSAIFAAAGNNSTGQGGTLQITTAQFSLLDGAGVAVGNYGQGDAGTLIVNANQIKLDNQAVVNSATASGNGGNLFLNARDSLVMRRGSSISASASGAVNPKNSGNSGNITINAKFLLAAPRENSDIVANAVRGQGGNVTITTEGIFGFTPRSRSELVKLFRTSNLSNLDLSSLPTNDIVAVSRENPTLNGQIQLNLPDVDPSRTVATLPTALVDRAAQITQSCRVPIANRSSFINSGRGGVPASPTDTLNSSAEFDRWITLNSQSTSAQQSSAQRAETPLVEAQRWVRSQNGTVALVAGTPVQRPTLPCR